VQKVFENEQFETKNISPTKVSLTVKQTNPNVSFSVLENNTQISLFTDRYVPPIDDIAQYISSLAQQ
jgi:hypothetical protein